MNGEKKKFVVAIYPRVSTENQSRYSLIYLLWWIILILLFMLF
ncbi:MAG: hypothetical protein OSJ65_05170 [Bacilli bacterium]|nr:hypothetical protein [Bacilli bacterium]